MPSSRVSRREFGSLLAAGVAFGAMPPAKQERPRPSVRVAAVQMAAEVANVEANLVKAERLAREALSRGAEWVVLPEFFTSAIAFHPGIADAVRPFDGAPARLLTDLAREGNAAVGGSFLAWRDGNAYNSFVLALPDGSVRRHDKDHPTFWENCYYVGGNDDGVLNTPRGDVGVALCWELIRSKTARRLDGRVDVVLGGSCWWTVRDEMPTDDPFRALVLDVLKATPARIARVLGVPVVHASHAGSFVGGSWPEAPGQPYLSRYLGEAQIVDGRGAVLARVAREEGDAVITADVSLGRVSGERDPIPDSFWMAEYPEWVYALWEQQLESGHEYYLQHTRPLLERRFGSG